MCHVITDWMEKMKTEPREEKEKKPENKTEKDELFFDTKWKTNTNTNIIKKMKKTYVHMYVYKMGAKLRRPTPIVSVL